MQEEVSGTGLISLTPSITPGKNEDHLRADVMGLFEMHPAWTLLSGLPLLLSAGVPLQGFKVGDLLKLRKGCIVASEWHSSIDVPLRIQNVEAAWCEFEVVEQKISVRITRLA